MVLLDVSSEERIGVAAPLLAKAGKTICIDHHVTNTEYCEINHVEPDASSACEVLFGLLEEEKISEPCADSISIQTMTTMLMGYKAPGLPRQNRESPRRRGDDDMLEDAIEQQPPYISDYF